MVVQTTLSIYRHSGTSPQRHGDSLARGLLRVECLLRLATGGEPHQKLPEPLGNKFIRRGRYWSVTFSGFGTHAQDSLGMQYIARLLKHPNRDFDVADLYHLAGTLSPPAAEAWDRPVEVQLLAEGLRPALSDGHPILDQRSMLEIRRGIEELEGV